MTVLIHFINKAVSRFLQTVRKVLCENYRDASMNHADNSMYPVRWTAQSVLHPGRPVHPGTNSTSLGSISSHTGITREDFSLIFPPSSIARYTFIQLREPGHHEENEDAQTFKR